jgi:hypothetical protein
VHKKNRSGSAGTYQRRPDWPLRIALVVLVLVWPVGLWVGASVSMAGVPGGDPEPTAVQADTCDPLNQFPHAPAQNFESAAWQTYMSTTQILESCRMTRKGLGDVSNALGDMNTSTGAWGTYGIGPEISKMRAGVGSCPTPCTGGIPTDLYAQLDALRVAWGAWQSGSTDYPTHSALWLLDRLDQKSETEIDRLGLVGDKLDTLHGDLAGIQETLSSTAPPSTTAPGTTDPGSMQTVALSSEDRAAGLANDGELASVLWVLVGCLCALVPAFYTMRELLT